jgi:hypothetical protein
VASKPIIVTITKRNMWHAIYNHCQTAVACADPDMGFQNCINNIQRFEGRKPSKSHIECLHRIDIFQIAAYFSKGKYQF